MKRRVWRAVLWVTAYLYIPVLVTMAFGGNSDRYVDLPFEAGEELSGRRVCVIYNSASRTVSLDDFVAMVIATVYRSESKDASSGTGSGSNSSSSAGGIGNASGDEEEMIKALAVLIRSDITAQMGKREVIDSDRLENGFATKTDMKSKWGDEWQTVFEKIREAVRTTEGVLLTFEGDCVRGLYTRVSPGVTMSGEKLLGEGYEYLVSVNCDEDREAADYERVVEYDSAGVMAVVKAWEKKNGMDCGVDAQNAAGEIQITSKTDEGYVTGVQVGDVCMSGEKFADMFGLNSPFITLEYRSDSIKLKSVGVGQGFGMSLYGANRMAQSGSSYEDILKYYYPSASIKYES